MSLFSGVLHSSLCGGDMCEHDIRITNAIGQKIVGGHAYIHIYIYTYIVICIYIYKVTGWQCIYSTHIYIYICLTCRCLSVSTSGVTWQEAAQQAAVQFPSNHWVGSVGKIYG